MPPAAAKPAAAKPPKRRTPTRRPAAEPPSDGVEDLASQMANMPLPSFLPCQTSTDLPAIVGESAVDKDGQTYINVNILALSSLHSSSYMNKVTNGGMALETRVFIPEAFFSIDWIFHSMGLDITDPRNWDHPDIRGWLNAMNWARENHPEGMAQGLVPSHPPMVTALPEACEERIVNKNIFYTGGNFQVYRELRAADGGRGVPEANHQMMAVLNICLLAKRKAVAANHWGTNVTQHAFAAPQEFAPYNVNFNAPQAPPQQHQPAPPPQQQPPPHPQQPAPPPQQPAPPPQQQPPPPPQQPAPPPQQQPPAAAAGAAAAARAGGGAAYQQWQQQQAQNGNNNGIPNVPAGVFAEAARAQRQQQRNNQQQANPPRGK